MRKIIYAVFSMAVIATSTPGVAQAKQIVPMHSQDVTKNVTQAFRSIAISADDSTITLRPGRSTTVRAHEEWNVRQPTLDITVSHGTLHVTISCNGDVSVGNVVTVAGGLDQANDCMDALALTVPASIPLEADTFSGDVTSVGARGGLKLSTGSGNVTIRDAGGPDVAAASGDGNVMGTEIDASSVSLDSASGDATATGIHAHSLTIKSGDGAVTTKSITTTVLTADSDSGDVSVSDADVSQQGEAHSGNGFVHVTRVRAGSLRAASDSGDVTVTDVHVRTIEATSGQGDVTARQLDAQTTSLQSDAGGITADLTNKPETLTATSGEGDVGLDVPTGRYDVAADSDNGTVHVAGLIIDTGVRPYIRAHSNAGNVTVTGH